MGGAEAGQDDDRGRDGGRATAHRSRSPTSPRSALADDFGVDAAALPPAARGAARRRRRLLLRGHRRPLQRRPGQQPRATWSSRVATVVRSKCGGIGPGRDPCAASSAPWRPRSLEAATAAWARWAPARGARGDVAAHRRGQRRARGGGALEDGARAGGGRGARATRSRCCASSPCWWRRPCRRRPARSGGASGWRATRPARACPATPRWGGYGGGPAVVEGRPAVPAARRPEVARLVRLPLPRPGGIPAWRRGRGGGRAGGARSGPGPGPGGRRRPDGLHRDRRGYLGAGGGGGPGDRRGRVGPRAWASIGLHPHEASEGVDEVAALLAREPRRATARWWRWASAGSTTTTSTRHATRSAPPSRRRSRWRTRTAWHWSSTRATPGRTSSTCSAPRACPSAPCCTASPVGPTRSTRCLRRGHVRVVQRHRHVQERDRRARRRRAVPARPLAGRDGQSRSSRRCRTAAARTSRRTCRSSARPSPP